jgi:hypothetical protein
VFERGFGVDQLRKGMASSGAFWLFSKVPNDGMTSYEKFFAAFATRMYEEWESCCMIESFVFL